MAVTMWLLSKWHASTKVLLAAVFAQSVVAQFNNPAGVDIWCGKAYRATYVIFIKEHLGIALT